jgi:hypothetical protein
MPPRTHTEAPGVNGAKKATWRPFNLREYLAKAFSRVGISAEDLREEIWAAKMRDISFKRACFDYAYDNARRAWNANRSPQTPWKSTLTPHTSSGFGQMRMGLRDALGAKATTIGKCILDTFLINGEPLRNCLIADVRAHIERQDQRTTFLRRLVDGLPDVGTVGDHVSDEEAEALHNQI